MSDTNQDDRLRLMPLVAMLADIEKPQLDLSEVFELALRGQICLYAPVPTGKVVYVDRLMPIVIHRRSSAFIRDAGDFVRYNPKSGQIHPEITHIALDPDQAGELKAGSRVTSDMAFASGLLRHPDQALAQAGWFVPCQFGASLVICPALPDTEVKERRQHVRRNYLSTAPEDIYVDERVFAMLADPHGSLSNDPYSLCRRAPGVYALYCVAEHYHPAIKANRTKFVEAKKLLFSLFSELGDTKVAHIANFINPHYRRNSGKRRAEQVPFDVKILDDEQFKSRYKRADFVTDGLALILYVTETWLDRRASPATDATLTHLDRSFVNQLFRRLGFYDYEEDALTELLFLSRATSRFQAWRKIASTNDVS